MDSADVWACPEYFQLDEQFHPTVVAGVPPDYFCEDGQLWGNPLYRWDRMEQEDFAWYLHRIAGSAALFDALRIDHFRGLESYWAVPAKEDTARNGTWQKGPGMKLISAMHKQFPHTQFIAEDLGFLTPEVHTLLKQSTFPGMKVLEFAFDSRESADYSPTSYPSNSVCYTGTHDNVPLMGWLSEAAAEDVALAQEALGETGGEPFVWAMLELGAASNSNVFMAQMQDYLRLGAGSRINTPGTFGDNWCWRLKDGQLTTQLAAKMKALAKKYDRIV